MLSFSAVSGWLPKSTTFKISPQAFQIVSSTVKSEPNL